MKPNRVAIIGADWPVYEKYCPNFTGMTAGLRSMGIEHKLFGCRPVLDVEAVIAYQPDLVIYGLLDMVKAHAVRMKIRRSLPDARIVVWYGDLRNPATGQIDANLSEIDMMFVSNDAQGEYYQKLWKVKECNFLPLGCQLYDPPIKREFAFDFVFIGAVITGAGFLDRARTMWRFRDNGLRIIDGDYRKPHLRAKIMKEMPSIYRSSKVSLDYSHFTDIKGYTSNRFWIVTGSGGFALTKRWPGCEEFYPEGTRVYFDTFEEAIALRDYYLKHEDEREKIRAAGHRQARLHTYDQRFEVMFNRIYGSTKEKIDHARISSFNADLPSGTPDKAQPRSRL